MIESQLSRGQVKLSAWEAYRVNRTRIALKLGVAPESIDSWSQLAYQDFLDVVSADEQIAKVRTS